MSCPGDWLCGACEHINFKKRDSCKRCGNPKYGGPSNVSSYGYNRSEVKPGDWYCSAMSCGAHNYASRSSCFQCGATQIEYAGGYGGINMVNSGGYGYDNGGALPGWKTGDWVCARPGCGMHNYACRMECYKCKTPREYGGAV